jgi:hypothetical protein
VRILAMVALKFDCSKTLYNHIISCYAVSLFNKKTKKASEN